MEQIEKLFRDFCVQHGYYMIEGDSDFDELTAYTQRLDFGSEPCGTFEYRAGSPMRYEWLYLTRMWREVGAPDFFFYDPLYFGA